ncbi:MULTISPECIES: hypothetical protein [unclassified Bradyrhizobium]|uniref:hypothetical protein n=1 Tax=unclassified Bradyrhizobium TaxID=2631580 RepID=UPI001FFA4DA1|nr:MULTISPECIES: hypothetical protein [unclassified Bradyrhizobium]
MKAVREGLAPHHCRRHVEHRARHGSYWRSTFTASELRPYITAATAYVGLRAANDKFIAAAIADMGQTLEGAGPVEIATRLKGMSATKRAKIGLARLRVEGVPPQRIVSIVLAVSTLIKADSTAPQTKEFRRVQIAKSCHRLASGTHRVWIIEDHQGRKRRTEMHAFPKSTGRVLREMGRMLEQLCEWVIEKHVAGVQAHRERYGRPRAAS